jgi:hypothetical protein
MTTSGAATGAAEVSVAEHADIAAAAAASAAVATIERVFPM